MADKANFDSIFARLKPILQRYEPHLVVQADEPDNYYLNTPVSEKYGKELFVGAVQIKKNYVSFHLMPVYMYPDLLTGISEGLKKRMQGKSCFNFSSANEALFDELADLTKKGIERVRQENPF
jgi:hypothetical protein